LDDPSGRVFDASERDFAWPPVGNTREVRGKRSNGELFPLEAGFSITNVGARLVVTGILRDISERRLLERQVLEGAEQLQREIGQDLHDGLGQLLTGAAFMAKTLEDSVAPRDATRAQRVVALINEAIGRVRTLARGLSPIHVESSELIAVLRDVVDGSAALLGVSCHVEYEGEVESDSRLVIAQLCLIVREAITNAVRHGGATHIEVALRRGSGSERTLTVQDDGTGLPAAGALGGFGVRSMRYRARLIGGRLDIEPTEIGTLVRCTWDEGSPREGDDVGPARRG